MKSITKQIFPKDDIMSLSFVKLDSMPLTPKGKIDRKKLSALDITNQGTEKKSTAPRTQIEETLIKIWSEILGVSNLSIYDNFFELGGDSIKAIQIISRLANVDLKCQIKYLFQYPIISKFALFVTPTDTQIEQGIVTGTVPLTPIQHWCFKDFKGPKDHINQAVLLSTKERLDEVTLNLVFEKILSHHDALRMTYPMDGDQFVKQENQNKSQFKLEIINLKDEKEPAQLIEKEANRVQESFDIENGPLMKVVLFKLPEGDRLLIVIHHLVIDGVSWRILFEDISTGYIEAHAGKPIHFPLKTDAFQAWAKSIVEYSQSEALLSEIDYWKEINRTKTKALPAQNTVAESFHKDSLTLKVTFSEPDTQELLSAIHHTYNTKINDVLLSGLANALSNWHGDNKTLITLESHGRDFSKINLDISRTVGWFTAMYPVLLDISDTQDTGERLKKIKETLRQIPNNGIGYGLLRYLTPHLSEGPAAPTITFNYLGQFDQDLSETLFRFGEESTGEPVSPLSELSHELSFVGITRNNQFTASVNFNPLRFKTEAIEGLLNSYKQELLTIISHCQEKRESEVTPSDLTWPNLSLSAFNKLVSRADLKNAQIQDIYPLSPLQSGMLFQYLYEEKGQAYFLQLDYRIDGDLDRRVFEQTWNHLFQRHDILRTIFLHEQLDRPLQIVLKDRKIDFSFHDWRALSDEEQIAQLSAFKATDRRTTFDITKDVLMRLSIFQLREKEFQVVWSFHHIILDGWCFGILYREFLGLYKTLMEGQPPALPSVTPYSEYIKWLEQADVESSDKYWQNYLAGFENLTSFPKLPETQRQENSAGHEYYLFEFDSEITENLNKLAARNQVTLYTVLQSIWAILLAKYNNAEDVLFGMTVSGRPEEISGIEDMLGLFINTIPTRIKPVGTLTFRQFLSQVQEDAVKSKEHHHYPLYKIQAHSPLRQHLFDHLVAFENYPFEEALSKRNDAFPYFYVKNAEVFEQINYDFGLFITPGEKIDFRLEYNPQVYEKAVIEGIRTHLWVLINSLLSNDEILLKDIDILSEKERHQILVEWNQTERDYPTDKCIHQLFEEQVEKTPEAVAVVFEDKSLTYKELNTQANQLAHLLIKNGVKPETLVGICIERSLEMIIGLMGILKAGGAYIPLDPNYPEERLIYMIEDSGMSLFLTKSQYQIREISAKIINLDDLDITANTENPGQAHHPDNLAYIIYTSGSTGRPKGVQIQHRSLTNFLSSMQAQPGITTQDVLLSVTTVSFDIAALELYLPLITGAKLVIANQDSAKDPIQLIDLLNKNNVTVMQATPATWGMITSVWQGKPTLKVLCGGEALSDHLLRQLLKWETTVWNLYGPTETTIWSTAMEITGAYQNKSSTVPIGYPIGNTKIYILDKDLTPVPIGVSGELYIGGQGLARGYHNRAALTDEKFIPNPFCPGERMYKTGDLVRYLSDGNIDFLGRIDHQVKIRGFRIELGEIESLLSEHPAVKESVVIDREDNRAGDRRLLAYVVSDLEKSGTEFVQKWQNEHISHWETIWQSTYVDNDARDLKLNLAGWNSSFTGTPIPEKEMKEWVQNTVTRIRSLKPDRVLEIGCGTGLLMSRIAPNCQEYWGTDFSQKALDEVQKIQGLNNVRLFNKSADDLGWIEPESFDTVILNSVVQYFPDIHYLLKVLVNVISLVKPGGHIFVGDVRNLSLFKAFNAAIQLYQAPDSLTLKKLNERIEQRMSLEEELVIEPSFFNALKETQTAITHISVWLKQGEYHNELTQYRYDAIIHVNGEKSKEITWLDWETEQTTLPAIRQKLLTEKPVVFGLKRVANSRVQKEIRCLEILETAVETKHQINEHLSNQPKIGIDPQSIWEMGQEIPYSIELNCRDHIKPGTYDVIFKQAGQIVAYPEKTHQKPWEQYANNPLQDRLTRNLVPKLRTYLEGQLPDYMVPSSFVILEKMPLTPSGKIDRKKLPAPENARMSVDNEYAPPRNQVEETLTDIWSEILGVNNPGIYDGFFELGGHSLLAIQVISKIRKLFDIELSLRDLFDNPKIAELAEKITATKPQQKTSISLPTIVAKPEERYEPFPLTEIQQAYWLGRTGTFELGNVATHGYIEIDCQDLDLDRFNQAWQKLIERHEMLRMIVLDSGQQQILEQVPPYQIKIQNLSDKSHTELESIREEMSHQVLPADQWPLFDIRASLLDKQRTRLHISFDALIADAWGMRIIGRDLLHFYHQPEQKLPPLELSFRDYIFTEQAWQETEWYQRSLSYWLDRLNTLPPAPTLPLARNPNSLAQPKFQRHSSRLDSDKWQQLKQRASKAGLTPSGLLLAVFADILSFWSKEARFTLNLTLFNRLPLHKQVNEIVGDFTSLILVEIDNTVPESFIGRAKRVQQQLWQDLDHIHVNGVQVLRELAKRQKNRQRALMPIVFTSTLTLDFDQNTGLPPLGEIVHSITQTPQVWLDHQVSEEKGSLLFNWDAIDELFPDKMLDDMFEAYCGLLERLAVSETAWLDTTTDALLPQWQISQRMAVNTTEAPISDALLHTLLTAQVKTHGHSPAVITSQRSLSYLELYQLANQVGRKLRHLGATPNTLVAVVIEKGWEQIVGVFGVFMSGAAYLPIDPDLPEERQRYLLEQGQVKLVLTESCFNENLEWPTGIQRLCVDTEDFSALSDSPLDSVQKPTDLAYVIFTSGSTGQPKGVMIDHRGAVNTIKDINQRFNVGPQDRVLALSALNFDLSVYDIFGLLATGGTVVMPDANLAKDPAHWIDLMNQHHVTVWDTVPALMQIMVDYVNERPETPPDDLRLSMMSGDWIPLNLPDKIKSLWPQAQVISLGGATEASIWSIYYPIESVNSNWNSIPYGKPLLNQTFHVFNQLMEPCPVWVPGQLYIGGIGLAQGYWRDEEKNQSSFIIHPHTQERLYKTGDLGRYLPDGNIEFLGREDFQVKIHGYRIELGEIEAALQQHRMIKDAVVNVVENQQLAAYIVPLQSNEEDYTPDDTTNVIMDPVERLEFKLKQPGLRQPSSAEPNGVSLYKPEFDEALTQAYLERQSYRQFLEEPISFEAFSLLLSSLLQMKMEGVPLPKYRYPSAGNLYPVQTYLSIKPNRVDGLAGGIYYYHPAEHRLELLHAGSGIGETAYGEYGGFNQRIFEQSAFGLFLVGQLDAITPLYGDWARDFCLLEAGYMSQLLMEIAPKHELGLCPIGNLDFEPYQEMFNLDSNQILLHSFLGGGIALEQTQQLIQSSHQSTSITESLRHYLQQKLPAYMIPATYMRLDALPLTPNGKVDRNALPSPEMTLSDSAKKDYVAPRTPTEEKLVQLWTEVLKVTQIGIHDDFFDLGGDSLLAIRFITQLRESLEINLSLRDLYEVSTLSQLAERIETLRLAAQNMEELSGDSMEGYVVDEI